MTEHTVSLSQELAARRQQLIAIRALAEEAVYKNSQAVDAYDLLAILNRPVEAAPNV